MKNVPTNLRNFKSKIDKLDVDKLIDFPVDLSKLSDVVKNDVAKKDLYNAKIKNIEDKIPEITNLATNTTLNAKINEVKNEIPSIINLATTTALNAKINEVKNKIPDISNLATTIALIVVENKIPNVSNLVKKTDYNTKFSETENKITTDLDHDKYITTQEFNKLTSEKLKLKQTNLVSKNDTADFVKKADFDDKLKKLNELSKRVKLLTKKYFSFLLGRLYFN